MKSPLHKISIPVLQNWKQLRIIKLMANKKKKTFRFYYLQWLEHVIIVHISGLPFYGPRSVIIFSFKISVFSLWEKNSLKPPHMAYGVTKLMSRIWIHRERNFRYVKPWRYILRFLFCKNAVLSSESVVTKANSLKWAHSFTINFQ